MPLHDDIRGLVIRASQEGWTWEDLANDLNFEAATIVEPLLQQIASGLSEIDRQQFRGFVPIVEHRGEAPEKSLARAKLMVLFGNAERHLRWSNFLEERLKDSPLFLQYPELAAQLDDDELLPAALFSPLPDAFEYENHVVAFSDFTPHLLRRRLTAIAPRPEAALRWRVASKKPVARGEYAERLEKAVEFGVPFTDELILKHLWQKHLPTVLRREAPANKVEEAYDYLQPLDRLEVERTEKRDGQISFLFEELLPISEDHINVGFVTTMIFHCDTVVGTGTFRHVDASLLVYDVDTYVQRLQALMKAKVKAQAHVKLFWLASCQVDVWRSLLMATYPRNELVGEYLTGVRSSRPVTKRQAMEGEGS